VRGYDKGGRTLPQPPGCRQCVLPGAPAGDTTGARRAGGVNGGDKARPRAEAAERTKAEAEAKAKAEAVERARREAEAAERAKAKAKAKAKAEAERARRERIAAVVAERDGVLRQVIDLGAGMAEADAAFETANTPLIAALKESRALGDLVPAAAVEAAQAALDDLREDHNLAQKGRKRQLRRLQAQVVHFDENPAYRVYLTRQAELAETAGEVLAGARKARKARDYDAAEKLAAWVLGQGDMPEDARAKAERFIDTVRNARTEEGGQAKERAERKQRRTMAKWFARAEKARQDGDFIIAVGKGQFAHLRSVGRRQWEIVASLGYEAPKCYSGSLPKRARRRAWRDVNTAANNKVAA